MCGWTLYERLTNGDVNIWKYYCAHIDQVIPDPDALEAEQQFCTLVKADVLIAPP